jgi:hypothetical protein
VNRQAGKTESMHRQTGKRGSIYAGKMVKRGSIHKESGNKRSMRRQPSRRDSMPRQTGKERKRTQEPGNKRSMQRQPSKRDSMPRQTGKRENIQTGNLAKKGSKHR